MKTFTLPNLRQGKPQVFCNYIFNRTSYSFKFVWCNEFCLLDIYIPKDDGNLYIVKGHPIVTDVDLISRVQNPELISGKLIIKNKYGKDIEPDLYNFNTDFEMIYYSQDELIE